MLDIFDSSQTSWWEDEPIFWSCGANYYCFQLTMKEWQHAIQTS